MSKAAQQQAQQAQQQQQLVILPSTAPFFDSIKDKGRPIRKQLMQSKMQQICKEHPRLVPVCEVVVGSARRGKSFIGNAQMGNSRFEAKRQDVSVTTFTEFQPVIVQCKFLVFIFNVPGAVEAAGAKNDERNLGEVEIALQLAQQYASIFLFVVSAAMRQIADIHTDANLLTAMRESGYKLDASNTVIVANLCDFDPSSPSQQQSEALDVLAPVFLDYPANCFLLLPRTRHLKFNLAPGEKEMPGEEERCAFLGRWVWEHMFARLPTARPLPKSNNNSNGDTALKTFNQVQQDKIASGKSADAADAAAAAANRAQLQKDLEKKKAEIAAEQARQIAILKEERRKVRESVMMGGIFSFLVSCAAAILFPPYAVVAAGSAVVSWGTAAAAMGAQALDN